jgi:RecA-family ATPase
MNDQQRAADALQKIPPDLPRDDWVRVGMAAHAARLDFDVWDQWSSSADNYDPRAARDTWRSFKEGRGVGPGSLFHLAKEYGTHHPPRQVPDRTRKIPRGMSPSEVWNRCNAVESHCYVVAKGAQGVPLDRLRVVPDGDPLRIAGQSMAGALVVPAYGRDGLQSLQLIPIQGKKLNMPGAPMAGASFTVGDVVPGGTVFVCEGIGAAWACWQATGQPAVVCFGWGNVARVTADLRERDASARLVLVPDAGKEKDAARIARDLGAAVACMPDGEPANFDANDYGQREGFDALEVLLTQAQKPEPPPPLLKPLSVADVFSNPAPPPRWAWDGYLPRGVVSMLGAHGGTGKSTVALMLALCADLGRPLFGVPVEQGPALFVSLEDSENVVRHRLAGICKAWHIDPQQLRRVRIVDGTNNPELFTAEGRGAGYVTAVFDELRELVQTGHFSLVVIDNASDAFGADEIQRVQVRAFIRGLASIAAAHDAAVLLLAHVDKNTSRARKAEGGEGYSGSTAWHNSVRSRLFMSRAEDGTLTLEHQKSNLGRMREPLTLVWPEGGLPEALQVDQFAGRLQGRADDERAAGVLRLLAEFESREQYCSPVATARNNVFATLRSEPTFKALKVSADACRRIINQCQRAGWIAITEYRTADRKTRERWTVTADGRTFAEVSAPSALSAPSSDESAQSAGGAPCAPSCVGGMGDSAHMDQGA